VGTPLRATLYMNRDLKGLRLRGLDRRCGARRVASAEDFGILGRHGAAEVRAPTRQWFTQRGLTLNEQQTRVGDGRSEPCTFLGDPFGPLWYRKDGHGYLGAAPAKQAVQRGTGRIRELLRPGNPGSWEEGQAERNRVLRGWANACAYGPRLLAYRAVEHYVSERVRHLLRRRRKVPSRGTKRFPAEVGFGKLGVCQLRRLHLGAPAHAAV